MRRQAQEMSDHLTANIFSLDNITKAKVEDRLNRMGGVEVYFSRITLEKYDKVTEIFIAMSRLYFTINQKKNISNENRKDWSDLANFFDQVVELSRTSILNEVNQAKKAIT